MCSGENKVKEIPSNSEEVLRAVYVILKNKLLIMLPSFQCFNDVGRNEAALQELKSEGGCHDYVVGDLTQDGECERIINAGMHPTVLQ